MEEIREVKLTEQYFEVLTPRGYFNEIPYFIVRTNVTDVMLELSDEDYVREMIRKGREDILESSLVAIAITCSRFFVRQLMSPPVEMSLREVTVWKDYRTLRIIRPLVITCSRPDRDSEYVIRQMMEAAETARRAYVSLFEGGFNSEVAEEVLPGCTATKVIAELNLRQWRSVFSSVIADEPPPRPVRCFLGQILERLTLFLPCVFGDQFKKHRDLFSSAEKPRVNS